MHRYIIRLHIVQATDDLSLRTGPLSTFLFDETIFIAVTAYQNDQVGWKPFSEAEYVDLINFFALDKKLENQ